MTTRTLLAGAAALALASAATAQLTRDFVTSVTRPVFITNAPGDADSLYIIDQRGRIRIFRDGMLLGTPFLDIDALVTGGANGGDERGLLGLAFHPDFQTNGRFFVNYTGTDAGQLTTFVVEYTRDVANPDLADPASAREIVSFPQPAGNHNAGWMDFSPADGLLYIATGDGGGSGDLDNNSQNPLNLLGNILRLDVSNTSVPYTVPASNPFVNDPTTLDEIWALGLRNPWRSSFDRATSDLYIADVGQGSSGEINFQPASSIGGENYGWRCFEGSDPFNTTGCLPQSSYIGPVFDYEREDGSCSVTGGYVYRGCELGEEFIGQYIYGDYCSGLVWALDPSNGFQRTLVGSFPFGLSTFGEGADGELYLAFLFESAVYRLANPSATDADGNGVVDACEVVACPGDTDANGTINLDDLLNVVINFGTPGPIGDTDQSGAVDLDDLLSVVLNFGVSC